jgi:hypothetical protein
MADFKIKIWDNERIFMIDFGRAPAKRHPAKRCPDIDNAGYTDEAKPMEHGPIVSARLGQPKVNVQFYRTEISTKARLYVIAADNNQTIRITNPAKGELPATRATPISFRPVKQGRTSIDIHYHWPDGPVIGRLYVDVRRVININVRAHIVTLNGNPHANNFLGEVAPATMTAAQHQQKRIRDLIDGTNQVWEPQGLFLDLRETVNSAWTNATLGGDPNGTTRVMHAMAHSPNRSSTRLNVYIVNGNSFAPQLGFWGLGPPIAWAVATGRRWPNTPAGRVGSGIVIDTNRPITGTILAHEFGHVFSLCSIVTAGANAGNVLQWHTKGDTAGPGNTAGPLSRDDIITRRRLMYPYVKLETSNNAWRNNVGYGAKNGTNMGALLLQRQAARDITFEESKRAYNYCLILNNLYAI